MTDHTFLQTYIRDLIAHLKLDRDVCRTEFCRLFNQATLLGFDFDDEKLARLFQVSKPTVARWARGEAAAHLVDRQPILTVLLKHALLKELDRA